MHFSRLAVVAACVASFGPVLADDPVVVDTGAEASPVVNVVRPTFTPTNLKAPFLEQFTDDWETRWKISNAKKQKDKADDEEEWQFIGTWAVEEPTVLKGMEGDNGLVLKDKAAHHAISARFPTKIDNKGKTLVVQYEVKLQDGLDCGGAYMKLLRDTKALKTEEFSNASPYVIMFGPDRCGTTNKVHFIFKHKNPKTGEYEEKHLTSPPGMLNEKSTTLYTLIINPDQTYDVRVNGESQKQGSLLEDFSPPVNPKKEIDDPEDKKPEDWVDQAKIADPEAKKPDDWDEDAPFQIVDEAAEKPDDWLEDEPQMIPDPEAEKPEDWEDEEDGDWVPPQVPNPKCAEASGCGPWEKPMIKNPDFKGMWSAPMIDNPAYKGVWAPRKIANPNFFEDLTPADLEPMGAIGFELWTMSKDILFDNIYIGHSVEEARQFQAETFDIKKPIEVELFESSKPRNPDGPGKTGINFKDDPVLFMQTKFKIFMNVFQADPIEAIKTVPEISGVFGVLIVTLLAVIIGGLGAGAQSPQVQQAAKKAKDKATEAKDKAADAVSTGAEKAQAEINKRTTRSG